MRATKPVCALSYPMDKFQAQECESKEVFSAARVFPHGLASNGQLLFALYDERLLFIASVQCGGVLPPKSREIPFPKGHPVEGASLVATQEQLWVSSGAHKFVFQIRDLLDEGALGAHGEKIAD